MIRKDLPAALIRIGPGAGQSVGVYGHTADSNFIFIELSKRKKLQTRNRIERLRKHLELWVRKFADIKDRHSLVPSGNSIASSNVRCQPLGVFKLPARCLATRRELQIKNDHKEGKQQPRKEGNHH